MALALIAPIMHQVYVLICWRLELFNQSISRCFGFRTFKYVFLVLFVMRLITMIMVAVANANTLSLDQPVVNLLSVVFGALSLYLFYSVRMYFGMDRAVGADHF